MLRVGRRKLAVGLMALAVGAGAAFAWQRGGIDALIAVSLLATLAGLAALGYFIAQIERRFLQNLGLEQERDQSRHQSLVQGVSGLEGQVNVLGNRIVDLSSHVDEQGVRIDSLGGQVNEYGARIHAINSQFTRSSEHTERLLQEVKADYARLDQRFARISQKESQDLFQQVEALMALYLETGSTVGFPSTRGWAASPDLLLYLYKQIRSHRVESILECGSGLSTLIMAYALRSNGRGRLVALEHLESFAESTHDLLSEHDLTDWAEVRLAPIEPVKVDAEIWPWYSLDSVPDGPFDLLFVDGPPGTIGREARFPAMSLLIGRLAPHAHIVVDDFAREDEREMANRWLELFPNLTLESLRHEKGTAVLRFNETERPDTRQQDP